MKISVASGKGGTGKTSVSVNLALSIGEVQFLDCDVEEPNADLLLHTKLQKTASVYTKIPVINRKLCNFCGDCAKFCKFNALFVSSDRTLVFPELCHSCGGCIEVCPQNAITETEYPIGKLKFGSLDSIDLVYGELDVGKPMSVPIIRAVKKQMKKYGTVILDSPPGASCPVVETVKDSDFCILVTEPTPFGLHDLKIAIDVLEKLSIPNGVIVNRAGIGDRKTYDFCKKKKIPILLEIPYSKKIAELYSRGIPFSQEMPEWKEKFRNLFNKINEMIER